MKKIIFSVLIISVATVAYAQKKDVRLNLYGAYVFDDKIDNYYSSTNFFEGKIKGGFIWGAGLEVRLHEYYGLELLYQRLDTHAPVNYYDHNASQVKTANLKLSINYIMAGGARLLHPAGGRTEAYGGFMLGAAILDAENPNTSESNSATKFAWGLRLGANIWGSEKIGLKLQTQFLSIPQGAGGGLYFGTGGAGAGVSTYSSMLQFVLGGGLTFRIGGSGGGNSPHHAQTM
jgi:hypothetical protein